MVAGALDRLFDFVQTIKADPNYTDAIGMQLGIVGAEDGDENPLPTFTLPRPLNRRCATTAITRKPSAKRCSGKQT